MNYLPPEERQKRAQAKREQAKARGLTPDWYKKGPFYIPPTFKVAIIGAGFAGLSAAWYLNTCGVKTIIYEASGRLGGRVRTSRTFVQPKIVEDGAELIGENHALWGLHALRFNLKLQELTDDEAKGLHVRTRFNGQDLTDAQKKGLDANLDKHFAMLGTLAREVDEITPWTTPQAKILDGKSIDQALDELQIRRNTLERTWLQFTLSNDNCASIGKQSFLGLLASISAARMGSDRLGMTGYWHSTETHRCDGGNDLLATKLAEGLPDLRLKRVVNAVRIDATMLTPVCINSLSYDGGGQLRSYRDDVDMVILAIPPSVWNVINFEPEFNVVARTVQHGPAVKYMSRYTSRFWEATKTAPTAKWDELGSIWEGTDNQGNAPPFDLTVFSGGPYVLPEPEYAKRLALLYPPRQPPEGVPVATQFIDWPKVPFIQTGYAVPGLGQVTTVMPRLFKPYAKCLYFAGEQCSPGFFGYMEGALQSGARAAREILLELQGRTRPILEELQEVPSPHQQIPTNLWPLV